MSKGYAEMLGAVSATAGGGKKVYDIVAALAPPKTSSGAAMVPAGSSSITSKAMAFAPGLVGAGAGYVFWKKHRVLGALAGHALVSNAMPIYRGGAERKRALCQLAVEGAGVLGALKYTKHPVLGWLGGVAAGMVATSFVQGSPSRDLLARMKGG